MEDVVKEPNITDHTGLIRLGGIAMLVGFTIHAVANWVLKVFPPEDPSLAELKTYLLDAVTLAEGLIRPKGPGSTARVRARSRC